MGERPSLPLNWFSAMTPKSLDYWSSSLRDTKEILSSRRTSVESLTCCPVSISVTHTDIGHINWEAPGHLKDQSALK